MLRSCILLLIFHISISWGFHTNGRNNNNCTYYERHRKENGYVIVGYDYKEELEDIYRPCCLTDENVIECIRDFFLANSDCVPSYGLTPDPLLIPFEKFFFPVSSMTITHINARCKGLSKATVEEFYVNRATNNVVLALSVDNFNFSSFSWFSYQEYARESKVCGDFSTFTLEPLKLTAIIPKVPYLNLGLAEIHATTPNRPPVNYIGPRIYRSNNHIVRKEYAEFNANIEIVIREVFPFFAPFLMNTIIQTEICDFGIPTKNYNGYNLGKCNHG